ncbi:MAG: DM13 domain-containing protein [Pseudomonadota bacterium]
MKNITLALALAVFGAISAANVQAAEMDTTLAAGSLSSAFSSWGRPSLEGDWKIVKDNGGTFIELSDNFRAKQGPDVKIFLSPMPSDAVTGDNAVDGSRLIKQISDFDGSARIAIPSDVDLNKYQSLVFHCEAYSKLWGSSNLR